MSGQVNNLDKFAGQLASNYAQMKMIASAFRKPSSGFKAVFVLLGSLFILLNNTTLVAQPECEITADLEMPVCQGDFVTLSVPAVEGYTYLWQPGGQTSSQIVVEALETRNYRVTVTNPQSNEECMSAPFEVTVRPSFNVTIEQVQLTCTNGDNDNGNTAMLQATAEGNDGSYTYKWDVRPIQIAPDNPSLAIGLKAHLWYFVTTTDGFGCSRLDSVFTTAYANPDVEIYSKPDTAYIQNPFIEFSFENLIPDSVPVTNHFWDFGDDSPTTDLLTPVHLFREEGTYNIVLTVFNPQGCDTVFAKEVKVLPVKLKVPNILTPNGDGNNDVLLITEAPPENDDITPASFKQLNVEGNKPLSLYYKSSSLVIFNRQGRIVYESDDYQNDWDGGNLPDGVYFYVLKCFGWKSNEVYQGSITIIR
jgi:PKD repeat protein